MLRVRKFASVVCAVVCLALPGVAFAQANHRPIEDFLAAQYTPPLWWYSLDYEPYRWARIDYNGYIYRWLLTRGVDLETTFEGEVTERDLGDGTAFVHVKLHGRNVFVVGWMGPEGELQIFGYPSTMVVAGNPAALAEIFLDLQFINPAGVGGALPDFRYLPWNTGVLLTARAEGAIRADFGVPEGTPGRMIFVARSPYLHGQGVPGRDYWPAEVINVLVVGR